MKTETLNNRFPVEENRSVIGSLYSFNLLSLIEKMRQKQAWLNGELYSMVLLNQHDKQVLLTALHEGVEINSFQANDSVTFQVIAGELKLHTQEESTILDEGQLITLHEHINYRLTAALETVFLTAIANGALPAGI